MIFEQDISPPQHSIRSIWSWPEIESCKNVFSAFVKRISLAADSFQFVLTTKAWRPSDLFEIGGQDFLSKISLELPFHSYSTNCESFNALVSSLKMTTFVRDVNMNQPVCRSCLSESEPPINLPQMNIWGTWKGHQLSYVKL